MVSILKSVGEEITVHVSNRKILNALNEWAGIPSEKSAEVMRVIDKLSKQGREAVRLELGPGRIDSSGDKIAGLKLEDSLINRLDLFLDLAEKKQSDPLAAVESLLEMHASTVTGAKELRELFGLLDLLGVDAASRKIDLTIVRGLGYYTGPVFECTLNRLPEFGSVFSGGRYDNLLERFSSVQAPAVGASIGVDRLLAALEQLSTISRQEATALAVITIMDQDRLADYIQLTNELRNEGIAVELYQGDQKGVGKQMKYADKVGIPFAVIIGSDEWVNNTVTVKNLVAGRSAAEGVSDRDAWLKSAGEVQVTIPRGKLVEHLRQFQQIAHTSGRKS
jgi:histidyl-tRNA synthetase